MDIVRSVDMVNLRAAIEAQFGSPTSDAGLDIVSMMVTGGLSDTLTFAGVVKAVNYDASLPFVPFKAVIALDANIPVVTFNTTAKAATLGAAFVALVPGPVTSLAAGIATATTHPLTWVAPTDATQIVAHRVEYKTNASSTWLTASSIVAAGALAYTVTGLVAATSYNFRVTPLNIFGAGTVSAVLTASTAVA